MIHSCCDRRPSWRPRPPDGFPALDGPLRSASAMYIIQCPAIIRLLRHRGPCMTGKTPSRTKRTTALTMIVGRVYSER